MCKVLGISRSGYYKSLKQRKVSNRQHILENAVVTAFLQSKKVFGARKIKVMLHSKGIVTSRRKIREIMKKFELVSVYQRKKVKVMNTHKRHTKCPNYVNRQFKKRQPLEVLVSDLTYVRVQNRWCYICVMVDLFNREIVGYSVGKHKDASLVANALNSIPYDLTKVSYLHSDRGSEFDNQKIDQMLADYDIHRSLSNPGNPLDNAVAESTFKAIKTEFIYQHDFQSLEHLSLLLMDYVHWWNNCRVHGSLQNVTPAMMRQTISIN